MVSLSTMPFSVRVKNILISDKRNKSFKSKNSSPFNYLYGRRLSRFIEISHDAVIKVLEKPKNSRTEVETRIVAEYLG